MDGVTAGGPQQVPRPLPPPPSTDPWREAYEGKRREALGRVAAKETNVMPSRHLNKEDHPTAGSSSSGNGAANGQDCRGTRVVSVAARPDYVDSFAATAFASMSNSKRKKLEDLELKKTSVRQLIKKVKVDMNRPPENWASEYEARKAAAISSLAGGTAEPKLGSLSAFHTGIYGGACEQQTSVTSRSSHSGLARSGVQHRGRVSSHSVSHPKHYAASSISARSSRPCHQSTKAFPAPPDKDQSNEFRVVGSASTRKPPPSPLDLIRMADRNPDIFVELAQRNAETAQVKVTVKEEFGHFQAPPARFNVAGSSSSTKKVSMASLFRQVKCDAKKTSEDWQVEYESRKLARLEEDERRRANQVMTGNFRYTDIATKQVPGVVAGLIKPEPTETNAVTREAAAPVPLQNISDSSASSSVRQTCKSEAQATRPSHPAVVSQARGPRAHVLSLSPMHAAHFQKPPNPDMINGQQNPWHRPNNHRGNRPTPLMTASSYDRPNEQQGRSYQGQFSSGFGRGGQNMLNLDARGDSHERRGSSSCSTRYSGSTFGKSSQASHTGGDFSPRSRGQYNSNNFGNFPGPAGSGGQHFGPNRHHGSAGPGRIGGGGGNGRF